MMDRVLRVAGVLLLLQVAPGRWLAPAQAQEERKTGSLSLGLTLGTLPVTAPDWDHFERSIRWAAWFQLPVRGPVGLVAELAWGRCRAHNFWGFIRDPIRDPKQPLDGPPVLKGDELTLLVGPVLHCGNIGPTDIWLGAAAGAGRHREWPSYPYGVTGDGSLPTSTSPCGRHEIRAMAELRLRLGGARYGSVPTLEIAHRWSRSQWVLREEPSLIGESETRLAFSTGLFPASFRLARAERPVARRPSYLYGRAVGGTLVGLTASVVVMEGIRGLEGRKFRKAAAYKEGLLIGAVTGSALSIAHQRSDWRILPLILRLAGGSAVALTQGWLMHRLFDLDLPDPGLMLTIPMGELLVDRLAFR